MSINLRYYSAFIN